MESALYVSGQRLQGLADDLQVVAGNIANANTSGYKRRVGSFEAVLDAAARRAFARAGGVGARAEWPSFGSGRIDFTQGPISRTGRSLDVAVNGEGFLVVDTPDGPRYTRKGRIHVSPMGELTDGVGNRFLSDSGSLKLPPGASEIAIDRTGQIAADGSLVGTLQIVDIPDKDGLVSEGRAMFRYTGATPVPDTESSVVQGALEQSNVDLVREMVTLTTVMRSYEGMSRLMRRMDSLHGKLADTTA
jgi:flagellar basal-body rod protein FlgF